MQGPAKDTAYAAMLKALRGCIHHDNALIESHKIPASLRRQIEAAIELADAAYMRAEQESV